MKPALQPLNPPTREGREQSASVGTAPADALSHLPLPLPYLVDAMKTIRLRSSSPGRLWLPGLLIFALGLETRANTPPVIGDVGPIFTLEDQPVRGIPVPVSDAESDASSLFLRVRGSQLAQAEISGTGATRLLSLIPLPNSNGVETVWLDVRDPDGATTTKGVRFHVLPVNDPPVIQTVLPDLTLPVGADTYSVTVAVYDPDNPLKDLLFTAESSNPQVLPSERIRFGWQADLVRFTLDQGVLAQAGRTMVTLRVSDGESTTSKQFVLEVVNPALAHTRRAPGVPVVIMDLDADGVMDMYLEQSTNGPPGWVELSRPGATMPERLPLPTNYFALTWADFDGDGRLEALGLSYQFQSLGWLRLGQDGDGRLQIQLTTNDLPRVSTLYLWRSAVAEDFDQDGDWDILLRATRPQFSAETILLRNEGGGRFSINSPGVLSKLPLLVAVTDFDADGDKDLLTFGATLYGGLRFRLFANNGFGEFNEEVVGPVMDRVQAAGIVDATGEGREEIWVCQQVPAAGSFQQLLSFFRPEGTSLVEVRQLLIPMLSRSSYSKSLATWADFNLDGSLDLLSFEMRRGLFYKPGMPLLQVNDGRGGLRPVELTVAPVSLIPTEDGALAGDFNGDGRPDLLTVGGNNHDLWTNALAGPVPPQPFHPGSLLARVWDTVVWFGWDEPRFKPGEPKPTYQVRVGTRPGGNDLVPSHARADGQRLLPGPGNAGYQRQFWLRLPQPPPERLYWTVQTVDTLGRGSPFAPEQMLVLRPAANQPPQISLLPDVVFPEDESFELEFHVSDDLTPPERLRVAADAQNFRLFPPPSGVVLLPAQPGDPPGLRRLRLTPAPDQSGESAVHVTVFDAAGAMTSGAFRARVLPVPDLPPPRLRAGRVQIGTEVYLSFKLTADRFSVWQVESSTNLVDWSEVGEQRFGLGNQRDWEVLVPLSPATPHAFFRLRQVP